MKKILLLAFALVLVGCGADEETKEGTTNIKTEKKVQTESLLLMSSAGNAITLKNFKSGQQIVSPLELSGTVPNFWQFEASFPIKIVTKDGTVLHSHYGTADWIGEDGMPIEGVVEFTSTLEFDVSDVNIPSEGFLRLERDQVTDEVDSEDFVLIPIVLKSTNKEAVQFEEPEIGEVESNIGEEPKLIPVSKPETLPVARQPLSHVESGINSYMSCIAGGGNTVITGKNEWSVCTSTDGRKFRNKIPGIWANEDIPSVTEYMACIMGGLPVDRTDPKDPVCFMPDGRILYQK